MPKPTRLPGSSPLTRGKLRPHAEADQAPGLIPAHAGKTSRSPARAGTPRAHPRSRGENPDGGKYTAGRSGSSPLTRGKHQADRPRRRKDGLIPAHAGKTQAGTYRGMGGGAHPRSRGENVLPVIGNGIGHGSSPLTRGKRARLPRPSAGSGLIPAHAGKTVKTDARREPGEAHPRSRGENRAGSTSTT